MTNNEINIAIAELSGWYPHPDNNKRKQKFWTHGGDGYGLPNGCVKRMAANPPVHDGSWEDVPSLPDYCNDLNAMREAESRFNNSKDSDSYIRNLLFETRNLIVREDSLVLNSWTMYSLVNSTAMQRAKAFLKTINK